MYVIILAAIGYLIYCHTKVMLIPLKVEQRMSEHCANFARQTPFLAFRIWLAGVYNYLDVKREATSQPTNREKYYLK